MRYFRIAPLLLMGCLGLAGCGGGGSSTTPVSATVVDGYIEGAELYLVPAGETTTTNAIARSRPSNKYGVARIAIANKLLADPSYHLIAVGGTDTATGASASVYSAPVDSSAGPSTATVVSPLTMLLDQVALQISSGSGLTQSNIEEAAKEIASIAGIDQSKALETILHTDYMSQAISDSNAQKALAMSWTISELASQKVLDSSGSLDTTVSKLASAVKSGSSNSAYDLVTVAAGSDTTTQAQALVVAESIFRTINENIITASSGTNCAEAMAKLQAKLHSSLLGSISQVNQSNAYSYITTIRGNSYLNPSNMGSAADLTNSTVKDYLIQSVSSGPIQELLDVNISTIQVLASASAPQQSASARKAKAAATNPCSGKADNTTVQVQCSDVLNSTFCTASAGLTVTASCLNGVPDQITATLQNYTIPGFNSKLNGTMEISNSSITLSNIRNGNTTYDGTIDYTVDPTTYAVSFSVSNALTIKSSQWNTLSLDSLTHGTITPAANQASGMNDTLVYLSGSGTTASGDSISLGLDYNRQQSAMIGSDLTDSVDITLNGTAVIKGYPVQFSNFGMNQQRYFNSQTDQNPSYILDAFVPGSKLLTSLYGYAYFNGSNIRFNYVNNGYQYTSGTFSLSTSSPPAQ